MGCSICFIHPHSFVYSSSSQKMFNDLNHRSENLTITFLDDEMMIARSGGIGEVFLWLRAWESMAKFGLGIAEADFKDKKDQKRWNLGIAVVQSWKWSSIYVRAVPDHCQLEKRAWFLRSFPSLDSRLMTLNLHLQKVLAFLIQCYSCKALQSWDGWKNWSRCSTGRFCWAYIGFVFATCTMRAFTRTAEFW